MFAFRNAGPSGHGTGRIRYYVDQGDDCIGSVEGRTGDYRVEGDTGAPAYRTRLEAAQALADTALKAATPPVDATEYGLLTRCSRRGGATLVMPLLNLARMLRSRGLLSQKMGTSDFRTTRAGLDVVRRYDRWMSDRAGPTRLTTSSA
jgi:hypothetical protein